MEIMQSDYVYKYDVDGLVQERRNLCIMIYNEVPAKVGLLP